MVTDYVLRHAIHWDPLHGTSQTNGAAKRRGRPDASLGSGAELEPHDWISGLDTTHSWQLQALPSDVPSHQASPRPSLHSG